MGEQLGPVVATLGSGDDASQRRNQLEGQLYISEDWNEEDRAALLGMILPNHSTYALSDDELGETSLIEHTIQLTAHTPVTIQPW